MGGAPSHSAKAEMAEKREREEGEIEENAAKAARLEDDEGTQECNPGTPIVEQEREEKCDVCAIELDPLSERVSCYGNYCHKILCPECSVTAIRHGWCCVDGPLYCNDCTKEMRNMYQSLPMLRNVVTEDVDLVRWLMGARNPEMLRKEFEALIDDYDPKQEEEHYGCAFEAKYKKTQKNLARIASYLRYNYSSPLEREQFDNKIRRKKDTLPLLCEKLIGH